MLDQGFELAETCSRGCARLVCSNLSLRVSFASQSEAHCNARSGIRTLVLGSKGQDDWPDYTNRALQFSRGSTDI